MAVSGSTRTDIVNKLLSCGEVTISVEPGRRIYAVNCLFCANFYVGLESFVAHIEETHNENVGSDIETPYKVDLNAVPVIVYKTEEENLIETECGSNNRRDDKRLKEFAAACAEALENGVDVLRDPLEKVEQSLNTEEDYLTDNAENAHSKYEAWRETAKNEPQIDEAPTDKRKEITLAIIARLEKFPVLWDESNPGFNIYRYRREAIFKITAAINRKLGLRLNGTTVKKRIKELLSLCLRGEGGKDVEEKTQQTTKTKIWYNEKTDVTQSEPKNKLPPLSSDRPTLPMRDLTEEQNISLIEIYKDTPCLWDTQHIGFRFKNQRKDALSAMQKLINEQMNLNLTADDVSKKLYRIRYSVTQEKHRSIQCRQSSTPYEPISKYYEQTSFLLDYVGPFMCEECEEVINGCDQYRIHKSRHDGTMPFTCPLCQRGFMKVGNCTVHMRRHTRDFPFECKDCGKRFATTTDLNVHIRFHTGEKPYFCEICGQSFRTWTFFSTHQRRHDKQAMFACQLCPRTYYERNKLTEHMKGHLNVRDKVCNECGKAFTSSKYLRQHHQIHQEKKKYTCKICDKGFAQYAGLSGHMRSHNTTAKGSAAQSPSSTTK